MGSANQVPISFAGYNARAIRRSVLVLAADLCTIISQVLLTRSVLSFLGCMWGIGFVAGENGPDDPCRFIGHSDSCDARWFAFQQ